MYGERAADRETAAGSIDGSIVPYPDTHIHTHTGARAPGARKGSKTEHNPLPHCTAAPIEYQGRRSNYLLPNPMDNSLGR